MSRIIDEWFPLFSNQAIIVMQHFKVYITEMHIN